MAGFISHTPLDRGHNGQRNARAADGRPGISPRISYSALVLV